MSENSKYNGWANYETWNVKLWLDNDQGSYSYWGEQATEIAQDEINAGTEDWKSEAANTLAERLKSEHEENMPDVSGTYSDLLTAALGEVDWYEIAEAMIEDVSDSLELAEEIEVEG